MSKVLILTFFDNFSFPQSEAGRKQAWWMANDLKKHNTVEIFYWSTTTSVNFVDGVRIFSGQLKSNELSEYDEVRIILSALEFRLLKFLNKAIRISIYILDGQPIPLDFKYPLRKLLANICSIVFDEIYILSEYQKRNLGIQKAKKMAVYLPKIDKCLYPVEKTSYPSILYMGHLKKFKGVDYLISSSYDLVEKYPNIQITFAINGLHSSLSTEKNLRKLHSNLPDNITITGVVDPLAELSKAWIYVYPFRRPHGTMAYALSIYEALSLGCNVIASDVGSNKEFFGEIRYLKKPTFFRNFNNVKDQLLEEICDEIDNRLLP